MLSMWNVNYQMLDIRWKEESFRNNIDILDRILNVGAFKVRLLCELSSDEIIADKGNMRSDLGRELAYI